MCKATLISRACLNRLHQAVQARGLDADKQDLEGVATGPTLRISADTCSGETCPAAGVSISAFPSPPCTIE